MKFFSLFFLFSTVTAMDVVERIYTPPVPQQHIVRLSRVLHSQWKSKYAGQTALDYDTSKKDFHIYRAGQLINTLHGKHLRTWKLTEDSNYLVMATDRLIQVFDVTANKMLHTVVHNTPNLKDVCYSQKHNLLFACHGKGIVNIWKLGYGEEFKFFKHDNLCNNATLWALALSHDEKMLAVGSADNCIKFFKLSDKNPKKAPNHIQLDTLRAISALAWHNNGRLLALGDFAGMVVVLDKETLAIKQCDKAHNESITTMRFVGNNLISYSQTQRYEREINGMQ